jgi:hypothetical protein
MCLLAVQPSAGACVGDYQHWHQPRPHAWIGGGRRSRPDAAHRFTTGIDPVVDRGLSIPRGFPTTASASELEARDAALDDTIESSFPASDPPSSIPDPQSLDAGAAHATAAGPGGRIVRRLEEQVARLPSDPFLWAAVGSMGVSAALQLAGKKHASLFVGQWAPAFLLLGVYDRLVKPLGSDRYDRS